MLTFEEAQLKGMQPSLLLNKIKLSPDTLKRLFSKINVTATGCWEWTASTRGGGYGAFHVRSYRKSVYGAHRLCYELVHGEQPQDLDIHHKVENGCMGPICCNPAHLEAVTRIRHLTELSPSGMVFPFANRDHCSAGHPYTIESLRIVDGGSRQCRICDKELKQKQRDEALALSGKEKFAWGVDKLKTHCKRGHELAGENLRMVKQGGREYRRCRVCDKIRDDEFHGRSAAEHAIDALPFVPARHTENDPMF